MFLNDLKYNKKINKIFELLLIEYIFGIKICK